jgi:ribosomal protein S3
MARVEKVQEGNLSFQRIKDPVDYALGERLFKYGLISIKVWMLSPKLRPYGTFKIQSYS